MLNHYQDDVFTWIQTRNELVKRGRWVDQGPDFWKVDFRADYAGHIKKLFWVHDIGVPAVELTKLMPGLRCVSEMVEFMIERHAIRTRGYLSNHQQCIA